MAEFDYINTPFGELEYLIPNFEAMMRGTKPEATANLANEYDVGTGTIETVYGADSTLGSSNIDPRYGIAYKDNNNLNADVIFNQDGRQANINAGLLNGNIYADYIKNINNNSTLNTGYQNDRGGFNITKDSDMGNTYAANLNVNPNTSLAFEKDDATKKLRAEYYPNSKSSLFAQAVNTDNGTGYGVGYNNKLTDNSNFKANFNRGPDKSYMAQLMLELGFK
tara:strand:+ start:85 stop:753 length:669 start_codon:yes stop_codon:yes gene_type:complete